MENVIDMANFFREHELVIAIGFYLIAGITWFFSTRRKLFLKLFTLPSPKRVQYYYNISNELWKKSLRGFAIIEFLIGTILWLI